MAKKKAATQTTAPVLKTRVAIILDSSGSMESIRREAVDMFNQQVKTIRANSTEMDTKVTLSIFETTARTVFFNQDVEKLTTLSTETYVPNGGTAMYDAIGGAIDALSFLPEAEDPNTSFLVIVVSDGQENASKRYSQNDIAQRITRLQATKRWTFSYLGANQDLTQVSRSLNIPIGNTFAFVASAAGLNQGAQVNSVSTANYMTRRVKGMTSMDSFYDQDQNSSGSGGAGGTSGTTK